MVGAVRPIEASHRRKAFNSTVKTIGLLWPCGLWCCELVDMFRSFGGNVVSILLYDRLYILCLEDGENK
jgi:triphosphoribosyl-dephospho-CoA synthetase